jgi:hypothetical protein
MTWFIRILTACLLLIGATAPAAAQRYADLFSVDGVLVDVRGPTAEDARVGAFTEAARRAWPRLWDKLADPGRIGKAPKIGDAQLRRMITAVDVFDERMSSTRYIARIAVSFDPQSVRNIMGSGAGFGGTRPMLLLPILIDGGAINIVNQGNGWAEAWAKFPLLRSRIAYIRADGNVGDRLLIGSSEGISREPERMRSIALRYRAEDVVIAQAQITRSYPGGPVRGVFTAFMGSRPAPLGQIRLSRNSDTELRAMFDEAIVQLDQLFSSNVRARAGGPVGRVIGAAVAVGGFTVDVATADADALTNVQQRLRGLSSVRSVTLGSVSLGGTSQLRLALSESSDYLRWELQQVGWHLDESGFLRERQPSDPVLSRPKTRAELEAEAAAAADAPPATTPASAPAAPTATTPAAPTEPPAQAPRNLLPRPGGR